MIGFLVAVSLLVSTSSIYRFFVSLVTAKINAEPVASKLWTSEFVVTLTTGVIALSLTTILFGNDLLSNRAIDIVGGATSLIILNYFIERSDQKQMKARLLQDLSSANNEVALSAIEKLRTEGWAFDDSLKAINAENVKLSAARLDGFNLSASNLENAKLDKANLQATNLAKANLRRADLRRAILADANLRGADLQGADLSGADLSGADLREANLQTANLSEAILFGANLLGALLVDAQINGAIYSSSTKWPEEVTPGDLGAKLES